MPASTVLPEPDEALDGYLERASWALGWPVSVVRTSLGMQAPATGPHPAVRIGEGVGTALDRAWGSTPGTAARMTVLGRYATATAVPPNSTAAALSRAASKRWFHISGSRYCPQCLGESGVWQVSWRLPWTIACPRHHLRLVDQCPGCAQWPRSASVGASPIRRLDSQFRNPRLCQRPFGDTVLGVASEQCGQDLSKSTKHPAELNDIEVQNRIHAALDASSTVVAGIELTPGQALTAWIELSLIAAHARGETRARTRLSPPRSTATTAKWLAVADEVAAQATPAAAAGALAEVLRSHDVKADANWFRDRLPREPSPLAQVYEEALGATGRVSTQLRRNRQQVLALYPVSSAQIPQLIWPCWVPQALRDLPGKPTMAMRQAYVSLCLARVIEGDWELAAIALGFPATKGSQWARYVTGLIPKQIRGETSGQIIVLLSRLRDARAARRHPIRSAADLVGLVGSECVSEAGGVWCPCVPNRAPSDARKSGV